MDELIMSMQGLLIGRRQLQLVKNYRKATPAIQRQMITLYGWDYLGELCEKFVCYSDDNIQEMIDQFNKTIDDRLDRAYKY